MQSQKILFRKGGGGILWFSLSWAMGRQRLDIREAPCKPQKPGRKVPNEQQVLNEVGHTINDLLYKGINKTPEQ